MPAMSVQDMISIIRDLTDDSQEDQYTSAELLRYINMAVSFYDGFLLEHAINQPQFYKDLTHDGSTELHRVLPYLPRIVSIERTDDSPRTETFPVTGGYRSRFALLGTSADYGSYYVQGNQIGIIPVPTSGTERVWYVLASPELHYGTCGAYAEGATDTGTSIILASTPTLGNLVSVNDAYNECQIMLTVTREINVITDYVRSTYKATVANTWENQPVSSTTVYSILPRIYPNFHALLPYKAITLANIKVDETNIDIEKEIERLEGLMLSFVRKSTLQQNHRVRYYGW